MGMILAIMLIFCLVSVTTYYVSKHRITEHVYHNYSGTFKLIGEGVARHQGANREQWLAAIERLSDLSFQKHQISEQLLTKSELGRLLNDKFLYQVNGNLSSSQAYVLLPDGEGYLSVAIDDYGTSLVRISAFLMLNELGRHQREQRIDALQKLREIFDYPIQLNKLDELSISTAHKRTIRKGDIAVVLNVSGASTPTIKAYAPLGNSPYTLVLGEIPFFDWFPLWIIASIVIAILVLMAAASFYLVRPLELKLAKIDRQVEQVAQDKEITPLPQQRVSPLNKLSDTVSHMAQRIHKLLDAQNDMVRAISHELRAPITRVRFQLAVLEEQTEDEFTIRGIEKNLEELEQLIDEVLTFSKLKRDMPELVSDEVDIYAFLLSLKASHQSHENELTVSVHPKEHQLFILDSKYMQRALSNLLLNAYKYAKQYVTVGFKEDDEFYAVWVEDDGPGIPEDKRNEVFSAFTRLDESRDRRSGGYGLGLAIVQQIARWHKGSVSISQSRWGGAKVMICWPKPSELVRSNYV